MYNAIQLSPIEHKEKKSILEGFNLGSVLTVTERKVEEEVDPLVALYTEAVFTSGKQSIEPVRKKVEEIKSLLEEKIKEQEESTPNKGEKVSEESKKKFDPKEFWRNHLFKELENDIQKIFGFRSVEIQPYIERYNTKSKDFESKELNAFCYHADRYPVDGLVTDKGFYDTTHSLTLDIRFSLGILKALTPDEFVAVMLHEFGHNIDPALVDIKYIETNILSKYMTDRKNKITNRERKFLDKHKLSEFVPSILILILYASIAFLPSIINKIKELILGKDKIEEQRLNKIREIIQNDKELFNRKNSSEAFADNFARMYGYGAALISALKKLEANFQNQLNSRVKKESNRQQAIINITTNSLKDVHKTDLHRIHSLIKEYEEDLKDPNIPPKVKEELKEDLDELKKILDEYLNNFGEFQSKVNKIIYEELSKKKDSKDQNKSDKNEEKEEGKAALKESVGDDYDDYYKEVSLLKYELISRACAGKQIQQLGFPICPYDLKEFKESGIKFHLEDDAITESKKAIEKMQKEIDAVTSKERNEFYKIFGKSYDCSLAKDKNGYYVRTHRARSGSYPEIKDIPKRDVDFIRSTS